MSNHGWIQGIDAWERQVTNMAARRSPENGLKKRSKIKPVKIERSFQKMVFVNCMFLRNNNLIYLVVAENLWCFLGVGHSL